MKSRQELTAEHPEVIERLEKTLALPTGVLNTALSDPGELAKVGARGLIALVKGQAMQQFIFEVSQMEARSGLNQRRAQTTFIDLMEIIDNEQSGDSEKVDALKKIFKKSYTASTDEEEERGYYVFSLIKRLTGSQILALKVLRDIETLNEDVRKQTTDGVTAYGSKKYHHGLQAQFRRDCELLADEKHITMAPISSRVSGSRNILTPSGKLLIEYINT